MQSNNFVKLSDMADLTVGYVGTMGKHYQKEGVLFLRSLNIMPFSLDLSDVKYISSSFNEQIKKSELKEGDVVIVRTGIPGTSTVIPKEMDGINCSDLVIVRPNKDKLNPYYLCSYINSWGRAQVKNAKVGAVQQHFNIGMAKNLLIPLPSKQIQDSISKLLSQINSKISLNNKIISELESMSKTIYDYWFLQFEFPNEEGKPYKSSGGKMVWNEELKREIPEGWKVGNLYDIADFINGLACQKYRPLNENKLQVIKITEMHDGFTSNTEYVREDIPSKYIVNNGDILFSWSASLEVMIWNKGKGCLNQHIFKVIPKQYGTHYVYMQLAGYVINFVKMAEARKTTMGHITTDHLKQSKIYLPNQELASLYETTTNPIFKQITKFNEENQELTSLRDFLLPLLMNGQVGFKNEAK